MIDNYKTDDQKISFIHLPSVWMAGNKANDNQLP